MNAIVEMLNNSASIATLFLLIVYIVGRCWYIKQLTNEVSEVLERGDPKDAKIIDEFNIGFNTNESICLIAKTTLLEVKVFKCEYLPKTGKLRKGECVCDCGKLRNGFAIKFNTIFPEGIPQYILEYKANDFTKGQLYFSENGKNGIIDELIIRKNTIKSRIYYFLK